MNNLVDIDSQQNLNQLLRNALNDSPLFKNNQKLPAYETPQESINESCNDREKKAHQFLNLHSLSPNHKQENSNQLEALSAKTQQLKINVYQSQRQQRANFANNSQGKNSQIDYLAATLSSQKPAALKANKTGNSNFSNQNQYFQPVLSPVILRNDSLRIKSPQQHPEFSNYQAVNVNKINLEHKGPPVRLEGLVLLNVANFAGINETFKLVGLSKHYYENMVRRQMMEDFWCGVSLKVIGSKTGYRGLKNKSLLKIDYKLKDMFYQVERLNTQSLEMQAKMFKYWLYTAFMVIAVLQPIVLVLRTDFKFEISTQLMMAPCTLVWALLIIFQIIGWIKIFNYYHQASQIHNTQFQTLELAQKEHIKGHITKHCSQYTTGQFINKMIVLLQAILTLYYFGFLLKIYIPQLAEVKYRQLQYIGLVPFIVAYGVEIFDEIHKAVASPIRQGDYVPNHKKFLLKFNLGLIPNYLIVIAFTVVFSNLLCYRLDGVIELSFFVILIPFWILLLYICGFVVLLGLASKNKKVNKCEKIFLALQLPIGFLLSLILAIWRLENSDDQDLPMLIYMFIPELFSFFFLYLYARCLVKPSGSKVHSEPQMKQL